MYIINLETIQHQINLHFEAAVVILKKKMCNASLSEANKILWEAHWLGTEIVNEVSASIRCINSGLAAQVKLFQQVAWAKTAIGIDYERRWQ